MSKKKKIIIISVICAALIIGVASAVLLLRGGEDDDLYKNFNEDEQYQLEKNGAKEYSSPVLVIYGEEGQLIGVTQLGNKVYLDNPDNIPVEQGGVASRIQITVGDDGIRRGTLCYPYSTNVNPTIYCSQEEAPEKMAEMRIRRLMNSPGYASILDYKINSVTVKELKSGEEGTAIINFTVNCDILPSKFGEVYGLPDNDGWCRGREYDYAIWGTYDTWCLLGEDPILELTGNYTESDTRVVTETQLYMDDDCMLRYACFEFPEQSILTDVPLGDEEDYAAQGIDTELLDDYEEPENYFTELFVIERTNNSRLIIEHGMENLQYNYVTDSNGKVYLTTKYWDVDSEPTISHLICFDSKTMSVTRIIDRGVVLGITDETLYAYGSRTVEGVYRPQDIYAIDLATGNIKWATEPVMIATEENTFIEQGVYDGYLHVMYARDKVVFKLDEVTGEWSFDYAG